MINLGVTTSSRCRKRCTSNNVTSGLLALMGLTTVTGGPAQGLKQRSDCDALANPGQSADRQVLYMTPSQAGRHILSGQDEEHHATNAQGARRGYQGIGDVADYVPADYVPAGEAHGAGRLPG